MKELFNVFTKIGFSIRKHERERMTVSNRGNKHQNLRTNFTEITWSFRIWRLFQVHATSDFVMIPKKNFNKSSCKFAKTCKQTTWLQGHAFMNNVTLCFAMELLVKHAENHDFFSIKVFTSLLILYSLTLIHLLSGPSNGFRFVNEKRCANRAAGNPVKLFMAKVLDIRTKIRLYESFESWRWCCCTEWKL